MKASDQNPLHIFVCLIINPEHHRIIAIFQLRNLDNKTGKPIFQNHVIKTIIIQTIYGIVIILCLRTKKKKGGEYWLLYQRKFYHENNNDTILEKASLFLPNCHDYIYTCIDNNIQYQGKFKNQKFPFLQS